MHTVIAFIVSMIFAALASAQPATTPADAQVLRTLRPAHPRLLVLEDDIARVRELVKTNTDVRKLCDRLRDQAVKILNEPTVEHRLEGPRLLSQSRTCLRRVATLAGMYRLEGDRRFAERAEKEMLTAATFADWNPSHFLDTAEMSNALGIGYDWLYDQLSEESRKAIRTAIAEKGLKPGLDVYRRSRWWAVARHNWNQVCNGGMTVGALAIADEEPSLAAEVISHARRSIPRAMASLAPDGGWAEGPGYWNYAMRYTAFYWAALNTALGDDFGLQAMPGFAETGLYRIHAIGPTGLTFNYADGGSKPGTAAQMMYFARRFDRPAYAVNERQFGGSEIFDLLWYDPRGSAADMERLPTAAQFRGIHSAYLRSKWNDPQALFIAFKGGDNKANHSHLDLGTFVLDALGQRWAIELGGDNYNMPGYFGKQRWTYYRLRSEGQNTLVLNGDNQNPAAKAPLVAFESRIAGGGSFAVADLTAAYAKHAQQVRRGVALIGDDRILVEDEIEAATPVEADWAMHTHAAVVSRGRRAILTLGNKKLYADVLEPKNAAWQLQEVRLEKPQEPVKNTRKLMVRVKTAVPRARVAVLFSVRERPLDALDTAAPLGQWSAEGVLARP
ncbi:MAG: heparinase II/III family protein [Phycisphaerae bacterium]|nr:heparinase II/III family protein [Phycisphaerae bacterium]